MHHPARIIKAGIAILVLTFCVSSTVRAESMNGCLDQCYSTWNCLTGPKDEYSSCMGYQGACIGRCKNGAASESGGSSSAGAYGAIAYDEKSGAWGLSDSSQDKSGAKKSALAYCGRYGKDCEIADTFSKTCASVAASPDGYIDWAENENGRQASMDAIKKCTVKANGERCFLQLSHCFF